MEEASPAIDRKVDSKTATNRGKRCLMIVKTPESQKGSPAANRRRSRGEGGGAGMRKS